MSPVPCSVTHSPAVLFLRPTSCPWSLFCSLSHLWPILSFCLPSLLHPYPHPTSLTANPSLRPPPCPISKFLLSSQTHLSVLLFPLLTLSSHPLSPPPVLCGYSHTCPTNSMFFSSPCPIPSPLCLPSPTRPHASLFLQTARACCVWTRSRRVRRRTCWRSSTTSTTANTTFRTSGPSC